MARIDTLGNFLTDVADSIRTKKGTTDTILASNFDTEIESIETGSTPNLQSKSITITENGTQTITPDEGYDGINNIEVNTDVEPNLQEKTIEINDEYMLDIIPDEGFYGLSKISIKVNPNKYSAYRMVEYIKGTSYVTGSNYFKTGIYPTNKTTIELKYSFYKDYNNWSNLYGSSRKFLAQSTTVNDTRVVALWNDEMIGNMSHIGDYNAHIIKQDKNVMYFDGSVFKTCTNAEWQDENELLLFGCPEGQDASAILYYCKIWEDDVLVRDFVPCYRKSDGAVGVFDKVENKFYENAGNVAFEKGADITA